MPAPPAALSFTYASHRRARALRLTAMRWPSAPRCSPCSKLRALTPWAIAVAVSLGTPGARAAEPIRLDWVRLEGASSCIDSAALENRVRRRLGTDPFDRRASRSIEGIARRSAGVWRAQITVRAHPGDANPPLRELESRAADCESLGNAAVLAVALAIDPASAFTDPPIEKPPARPIPVEVQEPTPKASALGSSERSGHVALWLAAQAGLLPRPSLGVGLGAGVELGPRLGIALGAQAFPVVEVGGSPAYAVGLATFDVGLCVAVARTMAIDFRACGGPSVGLIHAVVLSGDRAQPGERAWLAAELGFDATFTLTRTLAFDLGVNAVAPLTRYRFLLEGSPVALFEQSTIGGMARAGLRWRFP
jgi:hypothetical protein